jgi:hypothetical protein
MLGDHGLRHRFLFPQQTCKQHLSRFGELCSADGERNKGVLLGRHSSEANEDVGARAIRKIGSRAYRRPNINN